MLDKLEKHFISDFDKKTKKGCDTMNVPQPFIFIHCTAKALSAPNSYYYRLVVDKLVCFVVPAIKLSNLSTNLL